MRSNLRLAALAATALAGAFAPAAQAQVVQAGVLTCEVAPGVGLVLGSRKEVTCSYQNPAGDLEVYDGAITRIGVDIGVTEGGQIVWNVFAPSGRTVAGALAGDYGGAGAQATVGAGIGANALVGGFGRSVTLQPLSVSTQSGFNVAAGVAGLNLRLRPPARRRR